MELPSSDVIVEKLALPLLLTLSAWLLKDVVVGIWTSRREEARKEWLFRLREIYQPLHLWSGLILFKVPGGELRLPYTELSRVLSRAVTLLPISHYLVFVRLLEGASNQKTTPPTSRELRLARDYVYSQIEVLNFALFKQNDQFDPSKQVLISTPFRLAARLTVNIAWPFLAWGGLAGLLYAMFKAIEGNPFAIVGFVAIALLALLAESVRRRRVLNALKDRLGS